MNLTGEVLRGVLMPFLGTGLGAAWVVFLGRKPGGVLERTLSGFAAGVMVAASVWSLLLPAIAQSEQLGRLAFFPAAAGFWTGIAFLLALDELVPCPNPAGEGEEGSDLRRSAMLALAVTLHNVPEGMAVGVVYAGLLRGSPGITAAGALALSAGIAVQNVPEGAVISMPLGAVGMGRGRAFFWGVLSGAVEPLAAGLTVLCAAWVAPIMPCLLSFAAGAMFCVVVEELLPAVSDRDHVPTLAFALGFTLMMALDVAL